MRAHLRPRDDRPVTTPPDPLAALRTRSYLGLLLFAAVLGVPVSAAAYGFLKLTTEMQGWVFTDLPNGLGFHGEPVWWPLPLLAVGGVLVGLTIRYLPGNGGESPAEGFKARAAPLPVELPGIALAALATLGFGVVLGPEAPLIALGGGLAVCAVRLAKRDAPASTGAVVAAAGSFAAISTLLGSPILGAFLLMEASGLGGPALTLVLVPGLLAAGVGSLIFIGLNAWTGFGTFSLALPGLPPFAIVGLVVAGLAIAYAEGTGKSSSDVLFSGQDQLAPLLAHSAGYSVGALLLLVACKGLAYSASLSSFRGGPIFPAMFLGAAGGIALSHLPGLPLVAGTAMGIGTMCAVMLKLPMTSVLLATLLMLSDGLAVMPLVIVAVVVGYVVSVRLSPALAPAPAAAPAEAAEETTGPPAEAPVPGS